MTGIHDVERVMRRVTRDTLPTRDSERRIIIDAKHGRAVNKVGLLSFAREFKYYIVSNSDDPNNEASGIINLSHRPVPASNRIFNVEVDYTAWCSPGREKQVAESLCYGDPGEALNGLISRWTFEHLSSQNGSFKTSNSVSRSFLEAAIKTKALKEVGLTMELESSVKPLPTGNVRISDSFLVRTKDYFKEQMLNITVEVADDEELGLNWIQYTEVALRELIKTEVQDYFAHNVSLHAFYFRLNAEEFKHLLIRDLNEKLRSGGSKVVFLALERNQQDPLPAESLKVQINVPYSIDDDLPPVIVKNIVLMNLEDISKYLGSGSPELIGWVRGQLEKLINRELIRARVIDFATEFQPLEERIRNNLNVAASAIGYKLAHLKSRPDLKSEEWLEGIEIATDEEEFETSVSKFLVKLRISLTVRVKNLQSIERFLERQQHVPTLIKKAVLDSTRQLLRETAPEEFYARFSRTSAQGEPSFEARLNKSLSDMLGQEFNAEITTAIFNNGETKITGVLEELQRERCEFKILIPRNRGNAEDYVFRGHFKVDQVDCNGWEEFRRTLPSIAQVKEHLELGVKTALENHETALMTFRDTLILNEVQDVSEQAAKKTALNDFGLRVTLSNIGSDAVESQKKIAESLTKARTENVERELKRYFSIAALVTDQIQTLEHELVRVKAAGAPKQAIDDIQSRIEALKSHSPTEPIIPELYYEDLRADQQPS